MIFVFYAKQITPDFSEVKAVKWVKLAVLLLDENLEQSIKRMVIKTNF
jgi:hypothetical protein